MPCPKVSSSLSFSGASSTAFTLRIFACPIVSSSCAPGPRNRSGVPCASEWMCVHEVEISENWTMCPGPAVRSSKTSAKAGAFRQETRPLDPDVVRLHLRATRLRLGDALPCPCDALRRRRGTPAREGDAQLWPYVPSARRSDVPVEEDDVPLKGDVVLLYRDVVLPGRCGTWVKGDDAPLTRRLARSTRDETSPRQGETNPRRDVAPRTRRDVHPCPCVVRREARVVQMKRGVVRRRRRVARSRRAGKTRGASSPGPR